MVTKNINAEKIKGNLSIDSVSGTTISATTYLGLPIDISITGGTFNTNNGETTFTNNTGGTFNVSGYFKPSDDIFTTGLTFNQNSYELTIHLNNNTSFTQSLAILSNDMTITGGSYNPNTGVATFTDNSGGTFQVSGFLTGFTDTYVTGATYDNQNNFVFYNNSGNTFEVSINIMSGLTVNGGITGETILTNSVLFNTGATETSEVGKLKWNDADGTLDLGLKGGDVTLQIGQEEVVRVVNKTNTNLLESEYRVVRIRTKAEGGAQGQRLAVLLAQANTKANHSGILGIVTENINNNKEGFITTFGTVRGINTTGSLQGETWVDGDALWLSETNAGGLTNIEPQNHPVQIGYVVYAHNNHGKIFVSVQNGVDELNELHDVKLSGLTSGQTLVYNSSLSVWENKSVTNALGYTPENVANKTTNINGAAGTYPDTPTVKNYVDNQIVLQNRFRLVSISTDDSISITATPNPTILVTHTINGGIYKNGDGLKFEAWGQKNGQSTNTNWVIDVYINTTNSLSGATKLTNYVPFAPATRFGGTSRYSGLFKTNNLLISNTVFSQNNDITGGANNQNNLSVAINPANTFYIFIVGQFTGASQVDTLRHFKSTIIQEVS